MNPTLIAIFLLLVVVGVAAIRYWKRPRRKPRPELYAGLRENMLNVTREKIPGLTPLPPGDVWGAVMDWGLAGGTSTVIALSDGTASIYLSSGGGYLGGEGVRAIRDAAIAAVKEASALRGGMQPATDLALPVTGGVVFYALTDAGRFTMRSTQSELQASISPARRLGDAMQLIITEFMKLQSEPKK
jgi:hypothetical protein